MPWPVFCDVAAALGLTAAELARRVERRHAQTGPTMSGLTDRERAAVEAVRFDARRKETRQ